MSTVDENVRKLLDYQERADRRREVEGIALNRVLDEIHGLRRDVQQDIQDVREEIKGVKSRVTELERHQSDTSDLQRRLPRLSSPPSAMADLDLHPSQSGQVQIEEVTKAMSEKLNAFQVELAESKAREQGAKQALAEREAAEMRRQKTILFWVSLAGAGSGLLVYVFTHLLRL